MEKEYNYSYLNQKCHQVRIQIINEMISNYANQYPIKILSVGCGNGIIEKNFPGNTQGLDKLVPKETFIKVSEGVIENIPFEDDIFDIVFLGEILEHIYDTHIAFSEICRVLKKDGLLVITVPNVMNIRDRVRGLFGFLPRHLSGYLDDDPHLYEHIRHFNKKSLKKILEKNNFKILKFSSPAININFFGKKPINLYRIAKFLPSIGNNIICVARY